MSHWKEYKLGEIAELRKEGFMPNSDMVFPYIGLEHIEPESLSLNGIGKSSDVTSQKFKFYPNDVLYGKLRPYFKKVLSPNFEGVCSTDIYVVKAKNGVNSKYLFYLLATDEFTQLANSGSTGTRMPRADWMHLSETLWHIPDYPTQTAIASILSSLDEKIELNNAINRNLEALAQALFKQWFVEFEFPTNLADPALSGAEGYKSSGGEMVESELGEIPKGWRVEKINSVVNSIKESTKAGEHLSNRVYLPIDSMPMKSIVANKYYSYKEAQSSLILFEKYDILVGAMRVYFHRVNLVPFNGVTRTTCFVLRPIDIKDLSFILLYMNKEETIEYANKTSKGTTMPYAIWENGLGDMPIVLPYSRLRSAFNDLIKPLLDVMIGNNFENNKLLALRDTLLPKLISGELEVKDINTVSL